jgi:hypothetical protein
MRRLGAQLSSDKFSSETGDPVRWEGGAADPARAMMLPSSFDAGFAGAVSIVAHLLFFSPMSAKVAHCNFLTQKQLSVTLTVFRDLLNPTVPLASIPASCLLLPSYSISH